MASILIIDDEPAVRAFLRMVLELDGHTVHEAGSGKAGVALYRAQRPDLVLCDLFMKDQNGIETLRQLRQALPSVRALLMSGGGAEGMLDLVREAQALGVLAVLDKPIRPGLLTQAVQQALAAG